MQLSNYCNHLKLNCESEQKWDKTFQTYLVLGSFKHFEAPAHRTLSNFASKPLIKPHKGHWQDLTATNGSVAWKTWISCERLWKQVRFAELRSWLVPQTIAFNGCDPYAQLRDPLSKNPLSSSAAAGLVKGGLTKYLPKSIEHIQQNQQHNPGVDILEGWSSKFFCRCIETILTFKAKNSWFTAGGKKGKCDHILS